MLFKEVYINLLADGGGTVEMLLKRDGSDCKVVPLKVTMQPQSEQSSMCIL